ncbi:MAG: hypothetical protein J0H31_22965 [Alphaproteobacteria bacterium]|nr:hypothetical protein [Alphaproteobacteria bacterium]
MSVGGKPPFHHDFSAPAKSPAKRLFSCGSKAENRRAFFPELRLFSRNSEAENRRALFLELLWTGRIPVL